jgi:hypothetical protein
MGQRLELQAILEAVPGVAKVYFQPPASIQLTYPAIVYQRDFVDTEFADNTPYAIRKRYQLTIIDQNPDSAIPDHIAQLPMCSFDRKYASGQLNHDVYRLYF